MSYIYEYVWIDGNHELRSKSRVLSKMLDNIDDIPDWNYDGSSTHQANGKDSEIILKPCALFNKNYDNLDFGILVMCETYFPNGDLCPSNHRNSAKKIFDKALYEEPWFGLEQEYFICSNKTELPLGYDSKKEQGQYYCSVGSNNAFGRPLAEEHLSVCVVVGIKISGINAEVAPGQWEFQIGPCVGIEEGDHLWMARYILHKLSEKYNYSINFYPKVLPDGWNCSGCHANFSTKNMRTGTSDKTGLEYINDAIDKLSKKHNEHMVVYGTDNHLRMTGKYETSAYHVFSDGVADRGASIRRGNETVKNNCGYFEDRRPSSNCDPYLVTSTIFDTCVL